MSTIVVSPNDTRQYKFLKLPNDVEIVIISDPDTEKSAASCVMGAGSLMNPRDRPGLAHFIEHMQKLGTDKYPSGTEVLNYVKANSGTRNATTYYLETAYFFDIANPALEKALDMLGQFFICPLFTESLINMEMNIVDEEYRKNLLFDDRRDKMLMRMTAKPDHIFNSFPTGNIETLQVPTIRQEMLEFYDKYYSSNLLKIAVLGKESLEDLEKMVTKIFSDVKNKNVKHLRVDEHPFGKDELGLFFKYVPIADKDILRFEWYLENMRPYYRDNPLNYITSIILDRGKTSLISYLKDEGYALDLDVEDDIIGEFVTIFNIKITLTKKGLAEYTQVCRIVFEYLKMLREKEINKELWEEYKQILKLRFDYKDKENPKEYIHKISLRMLYLPSEDLVQEKFLMENYNPDVIKKIINSLSIDRMRIYLSSKSVESECTKTEKWYSIKYIDEPFSSELKGYFENPNIGPSKSGYQLGYPSLSKFVPKDFSILAKEVSKTVTVPKKVYTSDYSELYFKMDESYLKPKADARFLLQTNDCNLGETREAGLMRRLWNRLFQETLQELKYEASNSAFVINTDDVEEGFEITFSGFNDTIKSFISAYFEKMATLQIKNCKTLFLDIKTDIMKKTQNLFFKNPWELSKIFEEDIQKADPQSCHLDDTVKALKSITFEDLLKFHENWLRNFRIDALIIGNLEEKTAVEIVKDVENTLISALNSKPLPRELVPEARMTKRNANTTWFYEVYLKATKSGDKEPNSCCLSTFQLHESSPRAEVLMEMYANFNHEPCFNTLRTKELLGYIVRNYHKNLRGVLSFTILLQSSKKSPQFVSQRILAFLEMMKEKINNLTDEEFNRYSESVKGTISQKDLSIKQEGNRFWKEIASHSYLFNRKEVCLEELAKITKADFINFFEDLFFKNRKLLEIHIISLDHVEANNALKKERLEKEPNTFEIKSFEWFKKRLELYPDFSSFN